MMLNRFATFLLLIVLNIAVSPVFSFAQNNQGLQINLPYAMENELGVQIIPNYPRPNELVFLNLTLYTEDLNSANIIWYKDGKNVLSGKGEIRYSFKTGSVGQSVNIEVVVRLLSGVSFSKAISFTPASVDLVWEANSYVPPFYKGKALHPNQGTLKVVAMPEFVKAGRRISPQNLIYKWSNNTEVYQSKSGYGKNVLNLDGSLLGRSEKIEVLVTDPTNNLSAQGFVDISPTNPEIVFYENSPYYGHIFDSAINQSFVLKSGEIQILAAPYYFTKETTDLIQSEWRLNNRVVSDLSGSRTAIFRKPDGESGTSVISLHMQNFAKILQQADGNLTMNFEK